MSVKAKLFAQLALGSSIFLVGCGESKDGSRQGSNSSYIAWSGDDVKSSTLINARDEAIKVCMRGSASPEDLERAKLWAQRSILTWLRIGKVMDELVTSKITFTCEEQHMTFNLLRGSGRSYAGLRWTNIYLSVGYGTWTHELGHAMIALGDTYSGGTAGYCQRGQPQSSMCWGAYGPRKDPEMFSTLWPDDIEGFRHNYRVAFPDELKAPEWAGTIDLEGPLDVNNPWPGAITTPSLLEDHEVKILWGEGPTTILEHQGIEE